ncbi:hypothetical protein Cwoe_2480 [Conexibacter woesei DSM 14684]|uniref:Uncharacterized protein n=1 Tax=Conexibacter woesei (strain DSM 14684 / CCUG 47730 / CIP 108061 / JCM 11494 / NBRC 100937 / ID131577) TaxID=469383 RepID=D3F7P0_CONWI|nr:hypothetical protein Cwoe_2480 [Conexibacter woesei DSM 14684]
MKTIATSITTSGSATTSSTTPASDWSAVALRPHVPVP